MEIVLELTWNPSPLYTVVDCPKRFNCQKTHYLDHDRFSLSFSVLLEDQIMICDSAPLDHEHCTNFTPFSVFSQSKFIQVQIGFNPPGYDSSSELASEQLPLEFSFGLYSF